MFRFRFQTSSIFLISSKRFVSSSTTETKKELEEEPFIPDFSHDDGNNKRTNQQQSTRSIGQITKWVEDKGFGFVNLQGKSLFVHARELVMNEKGKHSPQLDQPKLVVGQTVEFSVGIQPDGRMKAVKISQIGGIPLGSEVMKKQKKNENDETSNKKEEEKEEQIEFDFGFGEEAEVEQQQQQKSVEQEGKSTNKKKMVQNNDTESSNHNNKNNKKLFSSYQWNCVEAGNPSIDGFKVTQFPTNNSGNTEIPVPNEKWVDDVDHDNNKKPEPFRPSSSSATTTAQMQDQRAKNAAPPLPSSTSRPIWESELLGWPTEFSAREMDFFDLEELEEKRSGWIR
jgi:cold shock CspA family protein